MQDDHRTRRFAAGYDRVLARAERAFLADLRARLVGDLTGHVVEIGAGTGANLAHYRAADRLDLAEPLPSMADQLAARLRERRGGPPARLLAAPAEALPLPDHSVDAVVSTLVLCSVADVDAALSEIRRILRPTGVFVFVEHGRGRGVRGLVQGALTPVSRRYAVNCHLDRDVPAHIAAAGFSRVEPVPFEAPAVVRLLPEWPFTAGRARQPS